MRPLLVVVVVAVHRLATVAQADQRDGTADLDSLACTNDQIALSGFVTQKNPMNKPLGDVQKTSFNVLYLPSGALLQTTTAGCDQPSTRPGVSDSIDSAKFPIFTYFDLSVQCGPRSDYQSVYKGLGNLFAGLVAPAKIYFLIYDSQVQQRATANGYISDNDISIDGKGDNVFFFFLSRKPADNLLDALLPADINESRALTAGNRTILDMYLDKTTTATCKLSVRVSANDNTDSDALRSFSKTSVLFVSVSFIILMVISLAWLVFYYVQRFRYAHAKDRLARRLFNAAKKALARIPTRPLRQGDKELEADCPVCIDPYRCGDIVRVLPCRHIFHKTCVDPWLLEHRTCPMCKSDILKAFGYNFGHIEDTRGQGTADDHASADGQSSDGSEGSGAESYSAYPFPLATDSDTHDPFSFTPTGSPQMVQQVLHSNNAQGFAIIPLTVHSTNLQSGARPGTGAGANQRPASMGNLTGQRSSDDSSLNDGLPSVPLHTAKSQHHSAQVHHPPVHSSSSSSCNALVLSGESSSSSDETPADPFKTPLTKVTTEPAATHVTRSFASPSGDRLVHKPKTLAPLRTSGAPVFETGVSLSNSSFPLRKSSREVVNLVHVRSRSLSQDVETALGSDASRSEFGAASSFDHGISGSVGPASPTPSTSTRQTSAGRPATAATFRRKSAATAKLSSDDSTSETKGKRNRRSHKYHSDENGTPDLGSLESL